MIENPVIYEDEHQKIVDAYNARRKGEHDHHYWSKDEIDPVRILIKKHYIEEQHYVCCYCGKEILSDHGRVWDVEHVVPKSTHPQFLFEPENLAVSCIECNSSKSDKPVLENNSLIKYPRRSEAFKIVHPHYDDMEEHIKVLGKYFYQPKTEKGAETISICGLMRFSYKYFDWDGGLAGKEPLVETFFAMLDARGEAKKEQYMSQLMALISHEMENQESSDKNLLDSTESSVPSEFAQAT